MAIEDYARMLAPTPLPPDRPAAGYGYGPEWLFYRMQQQQQAQPQPAPAAPAGQQPATAPQGNIFASEAGSQTQLSDTGPGGHRANTGLGPSIGGGGSSDWLHVAPGAMSVPMTGLSYGTGIRPTGQMHDVTAWNPGDMVGSMLGGATGVLGAGAVGGWLGGKLSPTYAASDHGATRTDAGRTVWSQDVVNNPGAFDNDLSSRERNAADTAMAGAPYMVPRTANPVPVLAGGYGAYTPAEAALRRAAGMAYQVGRPASWQPNRHAGGQMTGGQAVASQARAAGGSAGSAPRQAPARTVTRQASPSQSTTERGHNVSSSKTTGRTGGSISDKPFK